MMQKHALVTTVSLGILSLGLIACEDPPKPEAEQAAPDLSAAQAALPVPSAEPEPEKPSRPDKIDTELTSERRAALEKAYPDAKGFVVATELEKTLIDNKAIKEKEAAVKAFDKAAKGKWILFAGPLNGTANGLDAFIVYTPRDPADKIGISKQFFEVHLSDVEHDPEFFKRGGKVGVVLAKYEGNQEAKSGFEVVEAGHWQ
jgi:hypothetical protein